MISRFDYRDTLEELGKRCSMLGVIFRKAQNKIQDPAKLRRLIVDLIDKEQWSSLSADVKDDAYEGLRQKNAERVGIGVRVQILTGQDPPSDDGLNLAGRKGAARRKL